jgi:hypothetical protein
MQIDENYENPWKFMKSVEYQKQAWYRANVSIMAAGPRLGVLPGS